MHIMERMLEAHPHKGEIEIMALMDSIQTCFESAQSCTACADACLAEEYIQDFSQCIRINLDCSAICRVTGRNLIPAKQAGLEPHCATVAQLCDSL